jgi:hypothetical protein
MLILIIIYQSTICINKKSKKIFIGELPKVNSESIGHILDTGQFFYANAQSVNWLFNV